MADANARKQAIEKASTRVRSGSGFVQRASGTGIVRSPKADRKEQSPKKKAV